MIHPKRHLQAGMLQVSFFACAKKDEKKKDNPFLWRIYYMWVVIFVRDFAIWQKKGVMADAGRFWFVKLKAASGIERT